MESSPGLWRLRSLSDDQARGAFTIMKTNLIIGIIGVALLASCSSKYAIYGAAARGNNAKIEKCLQKGDDINIATKQGLTPLIIAVDHGYIGTVDYLIKHGANLEMADNEGMTALGHAKRYGYDRIAQRLIAAGAKQGNSGYAAAPSSIAGKTLYLDLRNCSYRVEMSSTFSYAPGTKEYNEALASSKANASRRNYEIVNFHGGNKYTGTLCWSNPGSAYGYTNLRRKASIKLSPMADGWYEVELTFKTPTSGTAKYTEIGGGEEPDYYFSNVPFTLK